MAVRWREEGAQLIGGCCGVGPDQIGAARTALAGKLRGAPRPGQGGPHELGGAHAAPPEPWVDTAGRSLYQTPVDPAVAHSRQPADFWGRGAVDHVIGLLPRTLAEDGVAYVLQISLLSQERTAELVRRHGLQARVVDFAFLPVTDSFRESAEQIARVERMSDAHHIEVCGEDVLVVYLLEIVHRR